MSGQPLPLFLCNGADEVPGRTSCKLDYNPNSHTRNVRVALPDFVNTVYHLPDRILDLLEIACYVFCADRFSSRGSKDALEFHAWYREFEFSIRVRDLAFWNRPTTKQLLADLLTFISGDKSYRFEFFGGHATPPSNLFDAAKIQLAEQRKASVLLFSGGLDSLAGAVEQLETTRNVVYLISHRSGQTATQRTQVQLANALEKQYPGRVRPFHFQCNLTGPRAHEETQRTRAFLYGSIGFALCKALALDELCVHENGVTAINLPRREGMFSARMSRTAHPKTLAYLQRFLSEVEGGAFHVRAPFRWETKSDVFGKLKQYGRTDLIPSSVSCSKAFKIEGAGTHCGLCSQCFDRRFAAYAAGLNDIDQGIYSTDFIQQTIRDSEAKTTLMDYVRQARDWSNWGADAFCKKHLSELVDVSEHVGVADESEAIEQVWKLFRRHGAQVEKAIQTMRQLHDNPFKENKPDSFLALADRREYLKEPIQRLTSAICAILGIGIPITFKKNRPKNEADFNDKCEGLLKPQYPDLEREHPSVSFALAKAVPDHSIAKHDLFIESKYVRAKTTPSKVAEGMAADLTKYGKKRHILFIVYDPGRSISDDLAFRRGLEGAGPCTVFVVR